jgi:segregation and condensation protein B
METKEIASLKSKLEALLFSSGRKMDIEELSRLANAKTDDIKNALVELKAEYDEKNSSVMVVNEGDSWKLTTREQFLSLVQKIITETELSKTIMETLAVIAFKYPIKQSDLIRVRTNKAYEHLSQLEQMGYITRQKHGRTNLIKLTDKFFEYFNLPQEKLKEVFKDFGSIAKAIENKEMEVKRIKEEQKTQAQNEKRKDEETKKTAELLDEEGNPLDIGKQDKMDEAPKTKIIEEKLGELDIIDEPSEEELEKDRVRLQEMKEEEIKDLEEKKEDEAKFDGPGIKLSEEQEKIAEEKAEKILHPEQEENKEAEEGKIN